MTTPSTHVSSERLAEADALYRAIDWTGTAVDVSDALFEVAALRGLDFDASADFETEQMRNLR